MVLKIVGGGGGGKHVCALGKIHHECYTCSALFTCSYRSTKTAMDIRLFSYNLTHFVSIGHNVCQDLTHFISIGQNLHKVENQSVLWRFNKHFDQ